MLIYTKNRIYVFIFYWYPPRKNYAFYVMNEGRRRRRAFADRQEKIRSLA